MDNLEGIKGWLLFLCVAMIFIFPLKTVNMLIQNYISSIPYFNSYPSFLTINILDILFSSILLIISIYAGISLWQKKQNSLRLAKIFLWSGIIYTFIQPTFILIADNLPKIVKDAMLKGSINDALINFTSFFIWYLYLLKSKRVANTFRYFKTDNKI
jgi:hypothetical protein